MSNNTKLVLVSSLLAVVFLFQTQSVAAQASIKLEKGTIKKTSKSEPDASIKIAVPKGRADEQRPIIEILPPPKINEPSTESAATKDQAGPSAPLSPCNFSLLLVNEIFQVYLVNSGVPCLGCTIPNDVSQSVPGVLGFSTNPAGPWTDTLTVSAYIDFSGNGNSEPFFIKGVTAGSSTMHMHSPWADNYFDFQVQNCSCPEIPIVP